MRMQGILKSSAMALLLTLLALPALGQDNLTGRWEGLTKAPQGERATTATFKKEGDAYAGTMSGQRGEMQLRDIKIDGDKVTAKADVETPQGALTIEYSFTLQGDALKGVGSLNFGGNPFSFDIELKRVGASAAGAAAPAPRPQRQNVEQPQQKQSIDYFVGQWNFKYLGRESGVGPAPREGVITFKKLADGKSVEGNIVGKHDGGAYQETVTIMFDETSKQLTLTEKRPGNVTLTSKGDWSSPIAIRFAVDPVKLKGQTLQLKRTLNVIAGHSFSIAEELSEDGGPFVRLGNAMFSKATEK